MSASSRFTLRPATKSDAPAIKALIRANRLNPVGVKWSQFVVAVTADNTLIGCGQVKSHRDGSRELASIAVVPEWRQQGIATNIIIHLMATHPPPLWLICSSKMIPFYQKFGFVGIKNTADMSPYFRRMARLTQWLIRLLPSDRYLAVMFFEPTLSPEA